MWNTARFAGYDLMTTSGEAQNFGCLIYDKK